MVSVTVHGVITPDGKLEIDLPDSLKPGAVEIEIRQPNIEGVRLGDLLASDLVGIWADRDDINDSVEYGRSLRRRASRRNTE